jgi:3-deoxy-D-manno-octulosonic-acid transferase
LIAETEIWPNIAIECKKRGIKLCIINGRISDRTYKSYKMLKFFFKPLLNNYAGIYTQSSEDLDKFLSLGTNPDTTKRMNNLKFDITAPEVTFEFDKAGRVLLCASTHSGEDEICINVYKNLKQKYDDLKLVIAPRHLTRIDEVETIVGESGFTYEFRSKDVNSMSDIDIMILDTMGELGKMFAYSDISFIGGSFNKTGGHNPLESVIFSKPVISGPSIHNFKDIYAIIKNAEAGFVVKSKDEFLNICDRLLGDKNYYNSVVESCINVFKSQQGALEYVINLLKLFVTIS